MSPFEPSAVNLVRHGIASKAEWKHLDETSPLFRASREVLALELALLLETLHETPGLSVYHQSRIPTDYVTRRLNAAADGAQKAELMRQAALDHHRLARTSLLREFL